MGRRSSETALKRRTHWLALTKACETLKQVLATRESRPHMALQRHADIAHDVRCWRDDGP